MGSKVEGKQEGSDGEKGHTAYIRGRHRLDTLGRQHHRLCDVVAKGNLTGKQWQDTDFRLKQEVRSTQKTQLKQ